MRGLFIDGGVLTLRTDLPRPNLVNEAIVRVLLAGICNTDLELTRGYMSFRGVPGHEFVGEVAEAPRQSLIGRRVVGEINAGCGRCESCEQAMQRHCPNRTTLGIVGRDGAHADLLSLPVENLHPVPPALPDEIAVFAEPLAAAYEVLEQRPPIAGERVLVLGDGKLGLLVAAVLHAEGFAPQLAGHNPEKLRIAAGWGIEGRLSETLAGRDCDYVVECTGSNAGLARALALVRPRGTVVLKSTVADPPAESLAPIVIDEITVIGSRCGVFPRALAGFMRLSAAGVRLADLISAVRPLDAGVDAYTEASRRGVLKVLLRP